MGASVRSGRQDHGPELDAQPLQLAPPLEVRQDVRVHEDGELRREVDAVDYQPLPARAERTEKVRVAP